MIRSSKVILKSNDLDKVISKIKKNKKKISLVSGVFDLLHAGHIKYFKAAKQYADILIVSLTDDKYVNKGLGKPFFKFSYRAEVLLSIKYIDYIVLSKNFHCLEIIQKVKPNFYVKGPDYKNLKSDITKNIIKEKKLTEKLGGKVIFINEETFSSSHLINKANIIFNNEQTKFLKKIKNQYSFLDIKKYLKKFEKKSIYCVGETIIDKYTFCETIGKSGKDPHLVINKIYQETYLGGAAAIARQLFEFGAKVKFLSAIGFKKENLSFIKKNLSKKINVNLIYKKNSPTIVKERFIDEISKTKIFGVYQINDTPLDDSEEKSLRNIFIKTLDSKKDSVLVTDYDHGLISNKFSKIIEKNKSIFLNSQINASNIGYHSLDKFSKVNTLIINEKELRHEFRDKHNSLVKLAKKIILKKNISNLVITRGSSGALIVYKEKKILKTISCPSFALNVVDKIGAGDTMLSIICLCLKCNFPKDLSIFLGSIMGALSVQQYANNKVIKLKNFLKTIDSILK